MFNQCIWTETPSISEEINKISSDPNFYSDYYIIIGDYNVVKNNDLDRKGNNSTSFHPQARKEIKPMMDQKDWLQFRFTSPDNRQQVLQQLLWLNSNILMRNI